MSIDPPGELARFHQFIYDHLAKGADLSPEEALDLWRVENPGPLGIDGTVEAVREALADMDAGDSGVPIDEFDRAFRRQHEFPA